jgi:hypothetical protein
MAVYTDWFLADESEAEALAKSESKFRDWPCLSMKGILDLELSALWGVLRGTPDSLSGVAGEELFADVEEDGQGGLVVYRVVPEFISALAALDKPGIERAAREWHKCEQMAECEPATVGTILREMVEFAQRARREGKPVLELAVW